MSPNEGTYAFRISAAASGTTLVIGNATDTHLTVARSSGHMSNRGDLTVGGSHSSAGEKKLTVRSVDDQANINVMSGVAGLAILTLQTAANGISQVTVKQGSTT